MIASPLLDAAGARGILVCHVHDAHSGRVIARIAQRNLIVTAGKDLIRDLVSGLAVDPLSHFAIGIGSTPPALADTTLEDEVYRDAITAIVRTPGLAVVRYYLTSGSANGNTIAEAGLFTDPAAGTLYARAILSTPIVKTSAIAVTFAWSLTW
jgi:hypothetical protein